MFKINKAGAILAIALISGPIAAKAQIPVEKFSLRISAGYGSSGFGDLDKAEEGHNARLGDLANLLGFQKTGELSLPHWGLDLSGEIVLRIAERLDIGIGLGRLSRTKNDSEASIRQTSSGALSLVRWTTSASVVPLTFNAHYEIPVSPRLRGFLKAGLGCYFANLTLVSYGESDLLGVSTWSRTTSRNRDFALGGQAGLVVEYGLSKALSCFVEGTWRFVNFGRWSSEYDYSSSSAEYRPTTSACWSAEGLNRDTGNFYPVFFFSDQEPVSANYQNVRKAEIDFSGWSVQAGLKLRLGK